ncbi:MAG: DUF4340 domain-containing protein, partial [Rhodothermales bacterium]|nr:DUF4340 domain-containing protein [Rhodothermales bacterium]
FLEGDTIMAVRRDGKWVLTKPIETRADSAHVRRLLDEVSGLEFGSVVSTNPGRWENYGVDSTASVLLLEKEDSEVRIVIGKQTPDFNGTFVRVGEDPRVFSTSRPLRVTDNVDQWRDKIVVNVPHESVVFASVQLDSGESFEVDRRGGPRMLTVEGRNAVAADSAAIARWIRRFAPLRGDGFVDSDEGAARVGMVRFETTGGATQVELLERETYLLLRRPDDGALLRVSSGRKSSLVPDGDSLAE